MKRCMRAVLHVVKERLKLTVGYPQKLYDTCGIRVCRAAELQMYGEYVAVTNLEKHFRCACYGGRPRTPLTVLRSDTKHIKGMVFPCYSLNFNLYNTLKRRVHTLPKTTNMSLISIKALQFLCSVRTNELNMLGNISG